MAHDIDASHGKGYRRHPLPPLRGIAEEEGRQPTSPGHPTARLISRTDYRRPLGGDGAASQSLRALLEPILHAEVGVLPTLDSDVPARRDRAAPIDILIIDDSRLQREGLAAVLSDSGMSEPAMAWDMPSLLSALGSRTPDIVLLSMATRDKISCLHSVREACPTAKVIVIGIAEDDETEIITAAEAGVAGYHLRSDSLGELLGLIAKVADGESVCSPRVSTILLKRLSTLASQRRSSTEDLALTTREMQILRMLELGQSNRQIADQLCITLHTVKNHVHSVLGKLGVSTRAEAAARSRSLR